MINKKFWAAIGTAALIASAAIPALAATEQGVTATVTPKLISLTVSDGSVAYGALDLDSEKSTKDLSDNQTVTNNGNVAEKIQVKTSNATGGTQWTVGTVGTLDVFAHYWSANPGDGSPIWTAWSAADTYAILNASLAALGTQSLGLKIHTPTTTTDYVQKSITVTVLATLP